MKLGKSLFTVLVLFVSTITFADGIEQIQLDVPRDPQSGRLYNENSNPDGVCRSLGYVNGVVGSIIQLSPDYNNTQDTLLVDGNGYGRIANGYGIWKITCRGNGYPPAQAPEQVPLDTPRDPQTGRLFNENSNADGVCRVFGYLNGVEGSIVTLSSEYNNTQDTTYVDGNGYRSVANGYGIWKITCRGNGYVPPAPTQTQLDVPRDPFTGRLFSENSNVDSVCRVMGFLNGVDGSIIVLSSEYNNQQDVSLMDPYGNRQVVMGYGIWKITCRR